MAPRLPNQIVENQNKKQIIYNYATLTVAPRLSNQILENLKKKQIADVLSVKTTSFFYLFISVM